MSVTLDNPEAVDRLAEKVAELLEPRLIEALEARLSAEVDAPRLVDAHKVADALGLTRATVYAMADELGAIRVGDGDKPRLRFDLERARSAWRDREEPAPKPANRAARRRPRTSAPLLPIRARGTS